MPQTATFEAKHSIACTGACLTHVQNHQERWGGDLLNTQDMIRLVTRARDKMIDRLKVDYGDYYAKIFEVDGKSRGRTAFVSAHPEEGVSTARFKRKLKMKILTMQIKIKSERESQSERSWRHLDVLPPLPDHYERMVWATGGHSSAAAHGNLFNESYTAFMNQAVTDVFRSIGIDFEGRNMAMGGTTSGPEIALCNEAVFGTDADVISWDFGMTDNSWTFRKPFYNHRIGIHPNRPAIIDLNLGKTQFRVRLRSNQRVEERGLTSLYLNPEEWEAMEAAIPDTFGLSSEEVDALPRMIRHYKCQDAIENGDPTCREYKYSNVYICPDRSGMTAWHPGWKRMAMWGNILALFLSDMLLDSLAELSVSELSRSELLAVLRKQEDRDYEMFSATYAPDIIEYNRVPLDDDLVDSANVSIFFRSPSICHTARLPAQSRYLGILTESDHVGIHDYFKGIEIMEAMKIVSVGNTSVSEMPLVYDENDRETCDEAELKRDHMDYFFVSSTMGNRTLTVPNHAEREAYGRTPQKFQGIIMLCSVACPWKKYPKGEQRLDELQNGTIRIEVNNQRVTNVTEFAGCSVLRGEDGHRWKENDDGQYVLKASVLPGENSTLSFFRISSFIVL